MTKFKISEFKDKMWDHKLMFDMGSEKVDFFFF